MNHPRFELYRDAADEWRFRLKAPNGKIVLQSEGYQRRNGAITGINAIKKYAPLAKTRDLTKENTNDD